MKSSWRLGSSQRHRTDRVREVEDDPQVPSVTTFDPSRHTTGSGHYPPTGLPAMEKVREAGRQATIWKVAPVTDQTTKRTKRPPADSLQREDKRRATGEHPQGMASTSQANAPSSFRDTGNVQTSDRRSMDCTKLKVKRILEMAQEIHKMSNSGHQIGDTANEAYYRRKTYYQRLERYLYCAVGKGVNHKLSRSRTGWLAGTNPPDNPNDALSEAVKSMRNPFRGMRESTALQLQSYVEEIKEMTSPPLSESHSKAREYLWVEERFD